ncbi:ralbp1-associated eps domain-containing protein [Plakobranchus ocellatus]|uniref:Ralbp1-associated eps domain-containing protein n=1 Tax=Plakobranchus ocellatus TaxID=259542 RepID=A0AAV4A1J6_9GAST|nr:ralbp1-associated eps domain-containing protein [Plakobranchus ocellatus]
MDLADQERQTECRVIGSYTRDLHLVFKRYDDNNRIKSCNLRKAFNDLHLFPSHSQIREMVHCAVEYGSPCDADHVTFGEFCVLVDELQHHYDSGTPEDLPKSIIRNKSATGSAGRRSRKESLANFQVFLGGSCGCSKKPSTWRHDMAIPFLKKENITFYNPQVNTWRPELVELEDRAKNVAELLFFVIDNNTRSVASLCEIAYLVGCKRQIIVVFSGFDEAVEEVSLEKTTDREQHDIARARNVLMDIIERNSIPVFSNIDAALHCAAVHLKQGIRVQDLTANHGAVPVKYGYVLVGEALLKLRESFNSITGSSEGRMSKEDIRLGYRCYTGEDFSLSWLSQRAPSQTSFSFEEFCCVVTEYKRKKQSMAVSLASKLTAPVSWLLAKLRGSSKPEVTEEVFDIYLGGSCGESNWRGDFAIPLLKREGISYLNPLVTKWSDYLIPMQAAEREKCRLLLFTIADCTRAIGAMVEAGYYIGLGCRVMLCLEKLQPYTTIAGEQMTDTALKDYNRGRVYLSDMASREGAPVFELVNDSLASAIKAIRKLDVAVDTK